MHDGQAWLISLVIRADALPTPVNRHRLTAAGAGLPSTACLAAVAAALAALPTAFRGHAKILQPWLQRLSNVREWGGTPSTGVMQCLSLLPRVAGESCIRREAFQLSCHNQYLPLALSCMQRRGM